MKKLYSSFFCYLWNAEGIYKAEQFNEILPLSVMLKVNKENFAKKEEQKVLRVDEKVLSQHITMLSPTLRLQTRKIY